ncbi:hypothetical protein F0224_03745 [Vibrio coralliilyticus]|uniref:hypothetical protein n=1 Tax=Vibrio coralliilyticus TaxID=190893 RepID=UPI000BAC24A6|nr:hypothetical protein [Vibrio coralliilyticus]NOI74780.1 hypothetical protein [Vibrio coralliilyticus]PAW05365.1 hypothetical protein CKJ79_03750 [Vibrio coralliilyticus]
MDRKLGRVMSGSRMVTFIAFLAVTFAWILKMPALFTVSVVALIASGMLYWNDKRKESDKHEEA